MKKIAYAFPMEQYDKTSLCDCVPKRHKYVFADVKKRF